TQHVDEARRDGQSRAIDLRPRPRGLQIADGEHNVIADAQIANERWPAFPVIDAAVSEDEVEIAGRSHGYREEEDGDWKTLHAGTVGAQEGRFTPKGGAPEPGISASLNPVYAHPNFLQGQLAHGLTPHPCPLRGMTMFLGAKLRPREGRGSRDARRSAMGQRSAAHGTFAPLSAHGSQARRMLSSWLGRPAIPAQ